MHAGVPYRLRPYAHDPAVAVAESYGAEAAAALSIAPERVLKTLVVSAENTLVCAVVPITGRLDLRALAAAVGTKRATMAEPDAAERATGYVVGGISPLGQRRKLRTVVDQRALRHASVLVSGGRRGLDVELTPQDLVRLTGAEVAPLAKA